MWNIVELHPQVAFAHLELLVSMENHPFLVGKLSINAPCSIAMVYIVSLKKIETCQIRFL